MKILHVIPTMNPKHGGPAQGIRNYEYGLKDKIVERHIICFDEPESVKDWLAGDLKVIPIGEINNIWKYHPKLKSWLYENMAKYDTLIINGIWQYHDYAAMNIINKLRSEGKVTPKVFIMPHGMLDPWFQNAKSRRLKSIRNSIYWHLFQKKIINDADGLLFTCQEELELAKTTFSGYRPKSMINVGYGIAPPPIYTEEMRLAFNAHYPLSKNQSFLLFMSRIDTKKGVDLLLDAYEQMLQNNKEYSIPIPDLVIAGPGLDTSYGKEMLQKVNQSLLLKERVHFIGMVSGDSKWGALYGCEAFVLSSHQENFGIAVVEALACGKPVLISNQVNIWKEIDSVGAGIINEDTVQGTLKSLEKFLSMPKIDSNVMKLQTVFAYKKFFDITKTAQNLLEAIN